MEWPPPVKVSPTRSIIQFANGLSRYLLQHPLNRRRERVPIRKHRAAIKKNEKISRPILHLCVLSPGPNGHVYAKSFFVKGEIGPYVRILLGSKASYDLLN